MSRRIYTFYNETSSTERNIMHTEDTTPRPQDCVVPAIVLSAAVFGVYQIGKLGFSKTAEGIRSYRSNHPKYMLGYN